MDAIKTFSKVTISTLLPCAFLVCVLCSCNGNSKTEKEVDKVASEISSQIVHQTNRLSELVPSRSDIQKSSNEQIEKTFAIEYKVIDLTADIPSEQIQSILTQLGKDRWDCFSITPSFNGSKLLCKRRPLSALRALIEAGGLFW